MPPPSWPYNRCHTLSDTLVICFVVRLHKVLQDVEVPNRLALREISPHTCLQSHVEPIDDARLRFFVVRRKVVHAVLFSNLCNDLFKNSEHLSVCNVIGGRSRSNCVKAATNDAADLFFNGMHQARFENTSSTVRRKVVPSLDFFNRDMSTRSACHCWFGPPTKTQRRLKRRLTGL